MDSINAPKAMSSYNSPANPAYPPPYSRFDSNDERALQQNGLTNEQVQQEAALLDSTLQWIPSQPQDPKAMHAPSTRLSKPVAIPRIDIAGRLRPPFPFLRAYSPVLAAHDINPTDFLAFIDNLLVAQNGSPAFQALNIAGQGVGFVPHHWAQAAGAGIQLAAGVGGTSVSIVRTKRFLASSNEKYFAPRGLKVSLKKDPELQELIRFPGGERALAPIDARSGCVSLRDRRLKALEMYTAPLTLDVPAPAQQGNVLDRISAKQLASKMKKKEKGAKKQGDSIVATEERMERLRSNPNYAGRVGSAGDYDHEAYLEGGSSSSSDSDDEEMQKLDKEIEKINAKARKELAEKGPGKEAKIEEKRLKEIRKVEKDRKKVEEDIVKKIGKRSEKGREKQEKNTKKVARMEYIVVENLD